MKMITINKAKQNIKIMCIIFLIFNFIDLVLTIYGVHMGLNERNPIMNFLISQNLILFISIKLMIGQLIYITFTDKKIYDLKSLKSIYIAIGIILIIYINVVISNYIAILVKLFF